MNQPPQTMDGHIPRFWRTRYAAGFLALAVITAYLLLSEHRAHILGGLAFLLVLACPLVHTFMHRDHGNHRGGDQPGPREGDTR